jgi:pimeloyl-ACP methyl ester carboxylesterase
MLAYSDTGAGPAHIFLHGMASDRTRWQPIVHELTGVYRCVSVDLPGHGGSPDDGCDALSAAVAVHGLVGHLGLDAPTIVGHSLGANVALLYAAIFEPRSVVAVDPVPLHLPDLAKSLEPYADRLQGDDFAAAFFDWEEDFALRGVPASRRQQILGSLQPRAEVVLSYWSHLLTSEAAAEAQTQFTAALTSVTVPTLVWLGDAPTQRDAAILGAMPTTSLEVFAGAGHFLHLDDPQGFADRLRRWNRPPH